mmetsp:Transcript_28632/g.39372  ORF Transcript_28632/g.39372 Transcript_28632/m.39372 type:complete len:140 (+) Transcript_28632:232-651(+)
MWYAEENDFMSKHFISSPENRKNGIWWSDFLSSFSQIEPYHLAGNLAALIIFGPPSAAYFGDVRFYIFITLSNLLCNWMESIRRDSKFASKRIKDMKSLGFSGINSALFVVYAICRPKELITNDNEILSAKDALLSAIC